MSNNNIFSKQAQIILSARYNAIKNKLMKLGNRN